MEIYSIENLKFAYPDQEKKVLNGIDISLEQGKFYILFGRSGCGKSTLLRHLKPALEPAGEREGKIRFLNKKIEEISQKEAASKIGFVFQNPENQIVTDKVWHELAFGLESLGCNHEQMEIKVAEMSSYFGIENWFDKNISELSGGQKQILNLASVMIMQPEVLILDEPTTWLDPMAGKEFLNILARINRELGITVILSEHNLENSIEYADELMFMEDGKIDFFGNLEETAKYLYENDIDFWKIMPAAMRINKEVLNSDYYNITVADCREKLYEKYRGKISQNSEKKEIKKECQINLKNVSFRYEKMDKYVVKDCSLRVGKGEIFGLLGGNGSGKSTLLRLIAGQNEKNAGKIAMLPQDVSVVFVGETIVEDYKTIASYDEIKKMAVEFDLLELLDKHPFDLSGGELQRAALLKILLKKPDILLLDEPTNGLDFRAKEKLGNLIRKYSGDGMTIVIVTHDLEFCASYVERVGLFFQGKVSAVTDVKSFFSGNYFYTTPANQIAKKILSGAVTVENIVEGIERRKTGPKEKIVIEKPEDAVSEKSVQKRETNISRIIFVLATLIVCPLLIFAGVNIFEDRKYLLISLLLFIYSVVPAFYCVGRGRENTQKLVVVCTLSAIAIVGRMAFYMLPNIKPMAAVTIISGIALGPESGFFVGALSMFGSNMIFGQGPWTPWQMFAMGLIGMVAGLLFYRLREKSTFIVSLYGFFAVFIFYGGIMNFASLLLSSYEINKQNLLAVYLSGFYFDCIHAVTTFIILIIGSRALLKKIDRIKKKSNWT